MRQLHHRRWRVGFKPAERSIQPHAGRRPRHRLPSRAMTPDTSSTVPSIGTLAWRQTLRDFRAGELRLLALAVMLAVAALSAVGFFADRLDKGLARDAGALLGGDAVVGSDKPTPAELLQRASELGLQTATSASFPSMGRAPDELGGASRLVAVKAVSDAYQAQFFHSRSGLQPRDRVPAPEPIVFVLGPLELSPVNNRSLSGERLTILPWDQALGVGGITFQRLGIPGFR